MQAAVVEKPQSRGLLKVCVERQKNVLSQATTRISKLFYLEQTSVATESNALDTQGDGCDGIYLQDTWMPGRLGEREY